MSQFRTDGFYLGYKHARALKLIAVAKGHDEAGFTITADSMLEQIVAEWLDANHSDVMKWLDEQEARQKDFAKDLTAKLGPKLPIS